MIFYVDYCPDDPVINSDNKTIWIRIDDDEEIAFEITQKEAEEQIKVWVDWDKLNDWEQSQTYTLWFNKFGSSSAPIQVENEILLS